MSFFKCDICLKEFTEQFEFFGHLKAHYDIEIASAVRARTKQPPVIISPSRPTSATNRLTKAFDSVTTVIEEVIESVVGTSQSVQDDGIVEIVDEEPTYKSEFTCYKCRAEFEDEGEFVEHVNACRVGSEEDEASGPPPSHMQAILDHDYKINSAELVDNGTSMSDLDVEVDPVDGIDPEATNEIIKQVELIRSGHGCMGCVERFSSKAKLDAHLKRFHPELSKPKKRRPPGQRRQEVLKCDECERIFNHRNSLVYHMRSHSGDRPYTCETCGKSFFATSALKVHMRLHSGEKPYKCEHCGRNFRQWGDLKYHMISIHSDIRQYQCEFCGKDFARKYSLIVHRRIHTQERDYKCEFCEKSFRASSYLQNHRRIHTGEKPHSCSVCGKPFRVRSDMKRHMASHTREVNRGANHSANSTNTNSVIVTGPSNHSSQEPQILTVGNHQIAIRNGETIQVAMLSEGHLTIAGEHGQPVTIVPERGTGDNGSAVSTFPLTAIGTRSSSSHVQTTTVTSLASSQLQTGIAYPTREGELETVTIRDANSGTLYVWPVFMN